VCWSICRWPAQRALNATSLSYWPGQKQKKKKKKIKTRRKTKRLKAKIRQLDATYQTAGGFNDRNHADVSMMLIMMMATLGEKLHCSIKKDRRISGKIYIFHPNKSKLNKIGFLGEKSLS